MADTVVIDCTTGEEFVRPLTAEEETQRQADADAAAAAGQARIDADARRAADEQAWRDAVTAASSIAHLKAVLLGSNTPVAPVVDRRP